MKQRLITFLGIVTAMVVAVGGAAVASEAVEDIVDDGDDTTLTRPEVEAGWDDEAGGVLISIGETAEGMDPCDGVALGRDEEGVLILVAAPDPDAEVDADAPVDPDAPVEPLDPEDYPGCLAFDGVAEDGKVNHGTMQSMVAKNLSPHDLDIPKGWIMREVAKQKPMKVKAKDALTDEDPEPSEAESREEDEGDDKGPKQGKAKGHDKDPKGPKQGKAKGHDREKNGKSARGG